MTERTPQLLADTFEPMLKEKQWARRSRLTLKCDSEDEAVLVAHYLKKRGWKTCADAAIAGPSVNELSGCWVVVVSGRRDI